MKHIFLESHNIKNRYFGFGQFNYHLIRSLYEVGDPNLKFTLYAKDIKSLGLEFGNRFHLKKYRSLSRYKLFRISGNYDLWHSMNQNTKIEPRNRLPYIMTIHDIHFMEEQAGDGKRLARFREKLDRCNALVYISEFAMESTHAHFDIPNIPEYVIHNGNPITDTEIPECFKANIVPNAPYLFSIGEMTERKNTHTLIEMLRFLPDVELVLAGNDNKPYVEKIKETISKHQLEKRVHITGKISETAKKYYLKNSLAFVFPSLREGFGIPPIEAMRFGKPVFLSNNTSLPEVGGKLAFYWDIYDPEYMAQVLKDGLETFNADSKYGGKLIAHAQSFNWQHTAQQYLKVYHETLASP